MDAKLTFLIFGIMCGCAWGQGQCGGTMMGTCNAVGNCNVDGWAAFCECPRGYSGPWCQVQCTSSCSDHGQCVNGACMCDSGWVGTDCSYPCPTTVEGSCGLVGVCVISQASPACLCPPGYSGSSCDFACPSACSGHGACVGTGQCECYNGYVGEACEVTCPMTNAYDVCDLHGTCFDVGGFGTCTCFEGYDGEFCTLPADYSANCDRWNYAVHALDDNCGTPIWIGQTFVEGEVVYTEDAACTADAIASVYTFGATDSTVNYTLIESMDYIVYRANEAYPAEYIKLGSWTIFDDIKMQITSTANSTHLTITRGLYMNIADPAPGMSVTTRVRISSYLEGQAYAQPVRHQENATVVYVTTACDCPTCGPGNYPDVDEGCLPCPANTWSEGGSYPCFPCRGCYTCNSTTGTCLTCGSGKELQNGACVRCTPNYWSAAGATSCTRCSGCETCIASTGICTTCPEGYHVLGGVCAVCNGEECISNPFRWVTTAYYEGEDCTNDTAIFYVTSVYLESTPNSLNECVTVGLSGVSTAVVNISTTRPTSKPYPHLTWGVAECQATSNLWGVDGCYLVEGHYVSALHNSTTMTIATAPDSTLCIDTNLENALVCTFGDALDCTDAVTTICMAQPTSSLALSSGPQMMSVLLALITALLISM